MFLGGKMISVNIIWCSSVQIKYNISVLELVMNIITSIVII